MSRCTELLEKFEGLEKFEAYSSNGRVQPKTKEELKQIIRDTIEKRGLECDLNFIDTSKITDMDHLFGYGLNKFNGDISKWNVSNVKSMWGMFWDTKFNGDISKWDTSKVKNMSSMFSESEFNGDISKWNVSNVKNMWGMFWDTKFNGDISKWKISKKANTIDMLKGTSLEEKYGTNADKLKTSKYNSYGYEDYDDYNSYHTW